MLASTIGSGSDNPNDTIDRPEHSARRMMSSTLLPTISEDAVLLETMRSAAAPSKLRMTMPRPTPVYPTTTGTERAAQRQLMQSLRRAKRRLFLQAVLVQDGGCTTTAHCSGRCHSQKLSAHRALMATLDAPDTRIRTTDFKVLGVNFRALDTLKGDSDNFTVDDNMPRALVDSSFKKTAPIARAPAA